LEKLLGKIAVHDYPNAPIAAIGWQCDILNAFEALNEELKQYEGMMSVTTDYGNHTFTIADDDCSLDLTRDEAAAVFHKLGAWLSGKTASSAHVDPKPAPCPDCSGLGYYATGDTDNPTQTQCERCHTVDPKPEARARWVVEKEIEPGCWQPEWWDETASKEAAEEVVRSLDRPGYKPRRIVRVDETRTVIADEAAKDGVK
jgi:hypothetical protein